MNVVARVAGDRWFAVADDEGHLASGESSRRFRRHDAVFDYTARTAADGGITVHRNGSRWRVGDPRLSTAFQANACVQAEDGIPHQDAGSVLLVEWCVRRLGVDADSRQLRVNIVIHDDDVH